MNSSRDSCLLQLPGDLTPQGAAQPIGRPGAGGGVQPRLHGLDPRPDAQPLRGRGVGGLLDEPGHRRHRVALVRRVRGTLRLETRMFPAFCLSLLPMMFLNPNPRWLAMLLLALLVATGVAVFMLPPVAGTVSTGAAVRVNCTLRRPDAAGGVRSPAGPVSVRRPRYPCSLLS